MKKIYLFLLLNVCLLGTILAQTSQENLNKYWYYRQRLKDYFVVVDQNDGFGTNIPFAQIKNDANNITMYGGDGNGTMQYYIGVLATEYRLLAENGQTAEAANTKNELKYALNAVNRLDLYAENYFRIDYTQSKYDDYGTKNPFIFDVKSDDLNGFFVRDDFGDNFRDKLPFNVKSIKIDALFNNHSDKNTNKHHPYEESKDNVWTYLANLALVATLVDDPVIVKMAKDIAWRMVNYMHETHTYVDNNFITVKRKYWAVENPVSGDPVEDGSNVEESGFNCESDFNGWDFGFAEAGNKITDYNNDVTYSDLHWGCSPDKGNEYMNGIQRKGLLWGSYPYYDTYSYRILASTIRFTSIDGNSTYDFLIDKRNNETIRLNTGGLKVVPDVLLQWWNSTGVLSSIMKKFSNISVPIPYEHLPLIALTLDRDKVGKPSSFYTNQISEMQYYETLLNSAPTCGTYNFGNQFSNSLSPRTPKWGISNRLVWPEKENNGHLDDEEGQGYYPGLDYMLLQNLYWLNYLNSPNLNLTMNDGWFNSKWFNELLYRSCETGANIVSSRIIPKGRTIDYEAGVGIDLLPGFTAEAGSIFTASIDNSIPVYSKSYFQLSDFNSCPEIAPINRAKSFVESTSLKSDVEPIKEIPKSTETINQQIEPSQIIQENKIELVVAPNPNNGSFTVSLQNNNGQYTIKLFSLTGVELYRFIGNNSSITNIININSGVYFLEVDNGKELFHRRVVCN